MASSRIVMVFADANGANVTFSYSYAKSNPSTSSIKNLVNGLITNGDIFVHPPVSAKSAKIVTTNANAIDLSE